MSDKELIELAAKAVGYPISEGRFEDAQSPHAWWGWVYVDGAGEPPNDSAWTDLWNPLTDDGDALRLSVKLKIDLCIYNGGVEAVWIDEDISETYRLREHADEEFEGMAAKLSATRRAIVRAAAEIGKAMP